LLLGLKLQELPVPGTEHSILYYKYASTAKYTHPTMPTHIFINIKIPQCY